MKKILITILFWFYTFLLFGQGGIDGYVRIFGDEFNNNGSPPDENEYHYELMPSSLEISCRLYEPQYCLFENGMLRLKAIYSPNCTCPMDWSENPPIRTSDFKSQSLLTFKRYKYGRFSVKAYIPYGDGIWPAFWLFGGTTDPVNHPYSAIDIFEAYVSQHYIQSNVQITNIDDHRSEAWYLGPNERHIYTLDWGPDYLRFFIDGVFKANLYNSYLLGNMNVIFTMGVTNSFELGNPVPAQMPLSMDLDWFNVDYPIDKDAIVSINNFESTYSTNTVYAGKEIYMSPNNGSVVVKGMSSQYFAHYLDLIATDKISLKPGFHAEANSYFRAWTVDATTLQKNLKSGKTGVDLAQKVDKYTIIPGSLDTTLHNEVIETKALAKNEVDENNSGFIVYPNPAHDKVYLVAPGNETINILSVIDLYGRIVISPKITKFSNEIDLSELPTGIYCITVQIGNKFYRKIITKY